MVCGLPSTVKVTWRPNWTAIRAAVGQLAVGGGSDDVMLAGRDALALQQVADGAGAVVTVVAWPSTDSVTSLLKVT